MNQRQRRIAVEIRRLILKENDQNTVWSELSTLTGDRDIIDGHPRLLRSLGFNDDDYEHWVGPVVEELIESRSENLEIMIEYLDLPRRIKHCNPVKYAELFGHTQLLIDELRNRTIDSSFALNHYILRIRDNVDADPELAIGSMKELLESVAKTVLEVKGETVTERRVFRSFLGVRLSYLSLIRAKLTRMSGVEIQSQEY